MIFYSISYPQLVSIHSIVNCQQLLSQQYTELSLSVHPKKTIITLLDKPDFWLVASIVFFILTFIVLLLYFRLKQQQKKWQKTKNELIESRNNLDLELSRTKQRYQIINDELHQKNEELIKAFKKSSRQQVKQQKSNYLIKEQKEGLEKAFKKSSRQHVKILKQLELNNQQRERLEKANIEIKRASKMKETFLANTSHEIRTPLNAILGFTNLLLKSELSTKQQQYLRNIKTSGDNLLTILNDILDISKITAGKLRFESVNFDLSKNLNTIYETMQVKANEKNIDFSLHKDVDLPPFVIGDPGRLNQILINITSNAIKFTPTNGKVQIYTSLIEYIDDTYKIKFVVSDNGIGIDNKKLDNIFESFAQEQDSTARKFGGTGLGLTIVKNLVNLQQGTIEVKSKKGTGTTFTVTLPYKKGKFGIDNQSKTIAEHPASTTALPPISILLAEDHAINQQLAIDTIRSYNPEVMIDVAKNGKIALQQLNNKSYDLIIMDIQMPEMDGIKATEIIRNQLKLNTPVLGLSAHALKSEKEKCLTIGMNDYLTKPFDPEELINKIFYLIKKMPLPDNKIRYNANQTTGIIDLSYLNIIYKGDKKKVNKMLLKISQNIPKQIDQLFVCKKNNNWEEFRIIAHTIKSSANYIGLDAICSLSKELEKNAAAKKNLDDISIMLNKISNLWKEAQVEVKKMFN